MYKVYAFRKGKAAHTKALALPIAQEVANRIRNEVTTAMIVNVDGKSNPPVGYKHRGNKYWCPYCGAERTFTANNTLGTKNCSVCGISTSDFDVKNANHLWQKEG